MATFIFIMNKLSYFLLGAFASAAIVKDETFMGDVFYPPSPPPCTNGDNTVCYNTICIDNLPENELPVTDPNTYSA